MVKSLKPHGSSTSRRVFKALGVFGSVQIVNVICSVVRTKFVAVWLGQAGIGMFGLYNSALEVINQLVQLNLRQSGVKEIAGATPGNGLFMASVVNRLGFILGAVGALLVLLLAPLLSRLTFGDYQHTIGFAVLSLAVFFSAVIAGKQAVFQAQTFFKQLARASMWGCVAGTVLSLAMLWIWGMDAIALSILSFILFTAIAFFIQKSPVKDVKISIREVLRHGRPVIKLGLYMTVAVLTTSLAQYLFLVWLRKETGESGVGIYQSGYTILNHYVSLIFTALAVEYFPRISRAVTSRARTRLFVNHEIMMLMWGLTACIVAFINIIPLLIPLLYDSTFLSVTGYLTIGAVGTIFKASSFVLAFVMLARGDGKCYLVTETISSCLYIVINVVAYRVGGLTALGYGYILWYVIYLVIVLWVYCRRYHMGVPVRALLMTLLSVIIVAAQAALCYCELYPAATVVSCVVVPACLYMLYYLFLKRNTLKE